MVGGRSAEDILICRLAEEMIRRWHAGDQVRAEELFDRHPELWHQPEQALEIIYEEICQRRGRGQEEVAEVVLGRFPQWRPQLEVMLECHRLLEQAHEQTSEVFETSEVLQQGETVAGYHLQRELGRGSAGRVFLARQPDLADRPVVVKFASLRGKEHLHLARLQHTHIVPLYAAHDDPARNLRILCMPYFGGTTLEHLLHELRKLPAHQRGGQQLMAILEASGVQATGPARQIFARLSHVQAMCWIGVYLAEALQYAHDSGLVHLDVKPANILIAADGQPMLLDFHLARTPLRGGSPAPEGIGGTLAYMPREQQLAFDAVARGTPIPVCVDGRADIYALGAALFEALGGQLPFVPGKSISLDRCNPQVSPGLADILGKCLATDASGRYARAEDLAADLRRHLTDRPLHGVRNRSWVERFRKWRRRRPPALRAWILFAIFGIVVTALTVGMFSHWNHLRRDAQTALEEGRKSRHRQHFEAALETLRNGLKNAQAVPLKGELVRQIKLEIAETEQARAAAQRGQLLDKLHALAEQVRGLYGIESMPADQLAGVEKSCRLFWNKRQQIKEWLEFSRTPEAASDLLDLALFAAELKVRLAPAAAKDKAHALAIQELDEAEELFGPSIVLDQERRRHRRALKEKVGGPPVPLIAQTAGEHTALGRSLLQEGDLKEARRHFRQALLLQPHGFWPNFYNGLCAGRLDLHREAVESFSVCIGAAPKLAVCYFNRGLVHDAMGLEAEALRDFDQALVLDPALAVAAIKRGELHHKAGHLAPAEADFQLALRLGANSATVYCHLAEVQLDRKDTAGARQHLQRALAHDPKHPQALKLWNALTPEPGPE
jgi:serine/threonine protein kinase/Tfp pilus assembly protein PilF